MPVSDAIRTHLPLTDLALNIMLTLSDGEQHGYAMIKAIELRGRRPLRSGTLYAGLQRLLAARLVRESQPPSEAGDRRRRYYAMTELGEQVLRAEMIRLAELLDLARDRDLIDEPSLSQRRQ